MPGAERGTAMKRIRNLMRKAEHSERVLYIVRTILIVLASSFVCLILNRAGVMKENILMVFLIGVLLIGAFTAGYEYGIIGAVVSVLMFNYFFYCPGSYICDHESGRCGFDVFLSCGFLHLFRNDGTVPPSAVHRRRE